MRISVADRLEITDLKPTADGYLAVRANIARTGVYQYTRASIGMTDGNPNELVGVYRPEDTVFSDESLASFGHRPITINHPIGDVSAKTWKKLSVGHTGDKVRRDGDHVVVDMLLMDEAGITAATSTHKELSAGYSADLDFEDGTAPSGEKYSAIMRGPLKGNHIALVPRGRAGSTCRIGDAAWPIEDTIAPVKETKLPHIMHDGLKIDLTDAEAVSALVTKLVDAAAKAGTDRDAAAKALTDAEAKAATDLKDAIDAKDKAEAEVASVKKELADSKITPEQLRDAAKAYAKIVDGAAKIAAAFKVEDSMTEQDIKKGAVLVALGDAYKDKSDAFFDAAFEIEVGKVKVDDTAPDAFRDAMANRTVVDFSDASAKAKTAREKMIAELSAPREIAK